MRGEEDPLSSKKNKKKNQTRRLNLNLSEKGERDIARLQEGTSERTSLSLRGQK